MKISLLFFIVSILLSSCREKSSVKTFERPVKLYRVDTLSYVDKSFNALVESAEKSMLAFEVGGEIQSMVVEQGDYLHKGELVASIDPIDYQLQSEAAKAQYLTAQAEVERYKRLLSKDAISQQQYEVARANFVSRESAYKNSLKLLTNTKLYAPFSGVVESVYSDKYERVQPYEPIINLINPQKLEITFTISPSDAMLMRAPDVSYYVVFDNYPNHLIRATLKRYTDISIAGEGFPVVLTIDDSDFSAERYNIKVGYSCNAIIRIESPITNHYTSIPLSAIYQPKGSNDKFVWIYNPSTQRVAKQVITTGELFSSDMIVVKSGITSGDMVVVAGVYQLTEDQKVKLL